MNTPRTLYEKIWDAHVVEDMGAEALLYVDLHLLNEVMSPQAFSGLRERGRGVRRPERTLAVADHNTPTEGQEQGIDAVADDEARLQLRTLERNARAHAIRYLPMADPDNGIVHVVAPELGHTRPGMFIVCGDSHTSTHGAFGALAHGIGTSEVEHVLATQTLRQRKSRSLRVTIHGAPGEAVCAKDYALAVVRALGVGGGAGHVIEYDGPAVRALSMEGRMTLCNMSIETGARAGLVAPDATTYAYLAARDVVLEPRDAEAWIGDEGARFHREVTLDVAELAPLVTWGTNPAEAIAVDGAIPAEEDFDDPHALEHARRALAYMGLSFGQTLAGTRVDRVFIGSCTNGRIEDLRAAAAVARGRRVAPHVRALVVPGSRRVMREASEEGLDRIFTEAGFSFREPGCSMCLGMNPDRLDPGERCASTSNRNFEGRQGRGGRTHLLGPAMAAAAAIEGALCDVRGLLR
jgi:3-isopropylmalate/(R)-2-methylmalate dehydratase large subunit